MFYRQFNLLFQDVILVGCGGTGSRVVGPLIQTIKQSRAQLNPQLYLVDGDIFESKNLTRQNCIERDLGRNKAVVLAERYGAALDFPVVAYTEMVEPYDNCRDGLLDTLGDNAEDQGYRRTLSTRKLWIMCVDSVNARLAILSHVGPNDVIIDAGNEDTFGQVSIFDPVSIPHLRGNSSPEEVKPFSGEYKLPVIPSPMPQYLEAMANPSERTGSCADLDQSLAINNLMAAGIINMVQNLAYNNKFYCRTHYYDLIGGNTSERMTHTWFNQVMNDPCTLDNPILQDMSIGYVIDGSDLGSTDRFGLHQALLRGIESEVRYIDPAILAALGK